MSFGAQHAGAACGSSSRQRCPAQGLEMVCAGQQQAKQSAQSEAVSPTAVSPAASVTSSWCSAHGRVSTVGTLRSRPARVGGGVSSTWTQLRDLVAAATAELDGISSSGSLVHQHHMAAAAAAAADSSYGTEPHCTGLDRPIDLAEVEQLAAAAMACIDGALANARCLRMSHSSSASLSHLLCDDGSDAGMLWHNNALWMSGASTPSTHRSSQDSCRHHQQQQQQLDGQVGSTDATAQLQHLTLLCAEQAAELLASKEREHDYKAYCKQLESELIEAHHDLQSAEAQLAAIEAAAAQQKAMRQQKHWQQVGELQQLMATPFLAASSGSAASSITTSSDSQAVLEHPFVKVSAPVGARTSAPAAAGSSAATAAAAASATPRPKKAAPPKAGRGQQQQSSLRSAHSMGPLSAARQQHTGRRVSSSSAPPGRCTSPASSQDSTGTLLSIPSSTGSLCNIGAPVKTQQQPQRQAGRRPSLSVDVRALRDVPVRNERYSKMSAGVMRQAGTAITAGGSMMSTSAHVGGERRGSDDTGAVDRG